MELSQADRNTLRASQHLLSAHLIGNIIEHQIQDPKRYKQLSKSEQKQCQDTNKQDTQIETDSSEMPRLRYKSKYLLSSIKEDKEAEGSLPKDVKDLLAHPWLNMDQVEFDKLEWMSDKAEKIHQERLKTSTQFDKHGRVVVTDSNVMENKEIDPLVSGESISQTHDIDSLVQYLDSTYQPQITYALNVITKIASYATMGYYDGAFDENIHDILLKNCLLRARHQVDNPNVTICQSALSCLRALICNTQVDEIILDRIYPINSDLIDSNLWLHTIEMDSQEFTIEMKDIECVQVDTILALICRTDILVRFTYLLENRSNQFSHTYYESILDILIRMARHSPTVCYLISRRTLLASVIKQFLPEDIVHGSKSIRQLSFKALKLIRIICQAAFELDIERQTEPSRPIIDVKIFDKVIPSLQAYIVIDCYNLPPNQTDQLFKLHFETLRTIKTLFRMEYFQSKMLSLMAMIRGKLFIDFKAMASLDAKKPLEPTISFDWQYAAHLIDLTGYILDYEKCHRVEPTTELYWTTYIKPVLFQWLTDIIREKHIPHLDVSIAIAVAVNHYCKRLDEKSKRELYEVMIGAIVKDHEKGNKLNLFKILARAASEKSQLNCLLDEYGRFRDPKGLPSFGCLDYNLSSQHRFKLNPVFDTDSPFILLDTFIRQLPEEKVGFESEVNIFIDSIQLNRYIRSITGYHKHGLNYESLAQQSLVAQYEIQIIGHSLYLLGCYYLSYGIETGTNARVLDKEPTDLSISRMDCYSNLCYYAISILGLINTNSQHLFDLKDKIFEKVLLNSRLQERVSKENYQKRALNDRELMGSETGRDKFHKLTSDELNILIPLYMSCDHPNRFWMFQPIIDYYYCRIKDPEEAKEERDKVKDQWFRRNMPWRMHTGQLASANDNTIVNSILVFNWTMMHYSPAFIRLIVQPNIEDYLCLIGSLFLDDDLFLHEQVSVSIASNLKTIFKECMEDSSSLTVPFMDGSRIIKPLDLPLADFFNKLVDQFDAVSYGNVAFSNLLLLFMMPESDIIFRRKLFQEKVETCLGQLRIGDDDVWAPLKLFIGRKEQDPEMRELIRRSGCHLKRGSFLWHYRNYHIS